MRNFIYNIGYFIRETKTIFKINALSNCLSLLSIGFIFFILSLIISGWWTSNQIVSAIQGEAEINVYYNENLESAEVMKLLENIKAIDGVWEAALINEIEARQQMEEILGREAEVLAYLDENPFSPYIEAKIELEDMEHVLERLRLTPGVEYIRDNREVLDRIQNIAAVLKLLGFLFIAATGVSTLIIIAHIIRQGIYNNMEQINTLRLLGAPESFIAFPFILVGLVLNLGGGILASALTAFTINYVYGQIAGPLPFIPMPPQELLIWGIIVLIIPLSIGLGIIGSLFGLASAKR